MAKYKHNEKPEEEYIDLVPILQNRAFFVSKPHRGRGYFSVMKSHETAQELVFVAGGRFTSHGKVYRRPGPLKRSLQIRS